MAAHPQVVWQVQSTDHRIPPIEMGYSQGYDSKGEIVHHYSMRMEFNIDPSPFRMMGILEYEAFLAAWPRDSCRPCFATCVELEPADTPEIYQDTEDDERDYEDDYSDDE
jgi:hypothetical protein